MKTVTVCGYKDGYLGCSENLWWFVGGSRSFSSKIHDFTTFAWLATFPVQM